MKTYKVWWSPRSLDDLKAIYDYSYEQSPNGANKVFDTLLDLGDSLEKLPERFPLEQHIQSEYFKYRFLIKWNYKILYRINENASLIIIARIVSTKQNRDTINVD